MSSRKPHFEAVLFDMQLYEWMLAGLTKEQIQEKSRKEWPTVPSDYVDSTYDLTASLMAEEKAKSKSKPTRESSKPTTVKEQLPPASSPLSTMLESEGFDPAADLLQTHRRRGQMLNALDARIAQADAPITLLNLYRGLLRDHEASCYKLMDRPIAPRVTQPTVSTTLQPGTPTAQSVTPSITPTASPVKPGTGILAAIVLFLCCLLNCGNSTSSKHAETEAQTFLFVPSECLCLSIDCNLVTRSAARQEPCILARSVSEAGSSDRKTCLAHASG